MYISVYESQKSLFFNDYSGEDRIRTYETL